MFMRFLQLEVKDEFIERFKKFYEQTIFPELKNVEGCLFAGLVKSSEKNHFISLTFWDTITSAENYEKKGVFKELVKRSRPYLNESTEWKIYLSDNAELEYAPVSEEPVIKKYSVKLQKDDQSPNISNSNMFVRIVSAKVQDGKLDEFKKIYSEEIIPELKSIKGCEYVYLLESTNDEDDFISLTIWNSREEAVSYELSGKFDELVNKIKHTFSKLFLWKMELEKNYDTKVKTSEDMKVESYSLVAGRSFV